MGRSAQNCRARVVVWVVCGQGWYLGVWCGGWCGMVVGMVWYGVVWWVGLVGVVWYGVV